MSRTGVGFKTPSSVQRREKRFVSPDNKHNLLITEQSGPTKRRKTAILTPDNAESVLGNAFDLATFAEALAKNPDIVQDQTALFDLMTKCVVDQTVLPFTSVSKRHLNVLGLDFTHRMELYEDRMEAAKREDSQSNTALQPDTLLHMREHFNVSKESGCRCIIDQYLLSAVVYAQRSIDSNTELKLSLRKEYKIMKPHIAVFTQLPVPHTKIECGDVSYTFHGILDYAVGFISADDIPSLGRGTLALDAHESLSGILEAKSLSEMKDAIPQITAQVLTILVLTERKSFTGALTNGALWRFFTAYNQEDKLKIYVSAEFASDTENGIIIELLKDMILYPKSPMVSTNFEEQVIY